MSPAVQLLRSYLEAFQTGAKGHPDAFVAIARVPMDGRFDDAFLNEFYHLADRTLSPDTRVPREDVQILPSGEQRPWKYDGPLRYTLFTSANYEECLLWEEPGQFGFQSFRAVAAEAWNTLPNDLKAYRPIHPPGDDWHPWQPEPAWQWLNFVFRRLRGVGGLVRAHRIGEVELLYFTVGAFRACALAIEDVEATPTTGGMVTVWRHSDRSYSVNGTRPVNVSIEEASILAAFLEAKASLDTKALESHVSNVSRVMKQLAEIFPGAIHFPRPERKGEGYYIHVRPAPSS
jgi:hypothetical protein